MADKVVNFHHVEWVDVVGYPGLYRVFGYFMEELNRVWDCGQHLPVLLDIYVGFGAQENGHWSNMINFYFNIDNI